MDYQGVLNRIHEGITPYLSQGRPATYIPLLAGADTNDFAMSLSLIDGRTFHVGCVDTPFSIQSIAKVFMYALALEHFEDSIYPRVGVEPSGNPFNSLVQLEYESGIPRNPFINPGAIVIADMLLSHFGSDASENVLFYLRRASGDATVFVSDEIADSEFASGYRNFALANLMKSFGNIHNDINEVLRAYFRNCSIMMSTSQLSATALHLANKGMNPIDSESILSDSYVRRINALMLTCGHYDASGEFAYRIGLPGKSGVGGGIIATVPGLMSIAVYSPGLNQHGNSLAGTKALELFTNYTGHSVF